MSIALQKIKLILEETPFVYGYYVVELNCKIKLHIDAHVVEKQIMIWIIYVFKIFFQDSLRLYQTL